MNNIILDLNILGYRYEIISDDLLVLVTNILFLSKLEKKNESMHAVNVSA